MTPSKPLYRKIKLTQGQYAIVDACDYEALVKHKWYTLWIPGVHGFYAARKLCHAGPTILMHREILGLKKGDKRQGDHGLHNTLDNRRVVRSKENLRAATAAENGNNTKRSSANITGFKGVAQHSSRRWFVAQIRVNYKMLYLGIRKTAKAASKLYVAAANKYHGRFAQTK
jgi:hypothetical protein